MGDAEKPATGVSARGAGRDARASSDGAGVCPGGRVESREEARKCADGGSPREGPRDPRGEGEDPRANAGTRAYRNVPFAAEEELGQNMAAVSEPARLSWCGCLAR